MQIYSLFSLAVFTVGHVIHRKKESRLPGVVRVRSLTIIQYSLFQRCRVPSSVSPSTVPSPAVRLRTNTAARVASSASQDISGCREPTPGSVWGTVPGPDKTLSAATLVSERHDCLNTSCLYLYFTYTVAGATVRNKWKKCSRYYSQFFNQTLWYNPHSHSNWVVT